MNAAIRARDLGWLTPPLLESGPLNAITDLDGVLVGHTTLIQGDPGPLDAGRGPIRTGVTAIRPHPGNLFVDKLTAAVHVLNGFGKTTGLEQVRELGSLETPILLTNTLNVWRCADYLVDWTLQGNPGIGINTFGTLNPVVGECNDGWLNDIQGRHVGREHVFKALDSAKNGPVPEGNQGAGTGTLCYRFKGGIGTASRVLPQENGGYTVAVLLQSNFGARQQLIIRGQPVGQWLKDWPASRAADNADDGNGPTEAGSCMMVVATDAPLSARQLGRLARRAPLGLARTGFTSSPGSGDYVIAFSTSRPDSRPDEISAPRQRLVDEIKTLGLLFQGVVESTEEAVLNSLAAARTMPGRDYHIASAVPIERVQDLLVAKDSLKADN
ncbi:P1 family peptidase [Chloroflexota bacterium]